VAYAEPASGRTIGRYHIKGVLGDGAGGTLYLAEDGRGAELVLEVFGEPAIALGRDLARVVARLRRVRSPFVTTIVDSDLTSSRPYIVTRYQPGPSLQEIVLRSGPLQGESLVLLARDLAEGMAAMHRVGVLHRDIKPGNVHMNDGRPVLTDFTLAQLPRPGEPPRLPGGDFQVTGTPGFLAPEVLLNQPVGPPADVFSWAATVAYAGTGRRPFNAESTEAVLDRVLREEPDLHGVPEPLLSLLRRALAKDPSERPLSHEVASTVSLYHNTREPAGQMAYGPPPTQAALPLPRPRAFAIPLATGWLRSIKLAQARRALARGRYEQAATMLHRLVISADAPTRDTIIAQAALGAALRGKGDLLAASAAYQQALDLAVATRGIDAASISTLRANATIVRYELARSEHAPTALLRNLDTEAVTDNAEFAVALHDEGRLEEAEAEAQAALIQGLEAKTPDVPVLQANLAAIRRGRGDPSTAEELLVQAERAARRALGRRHPETLTLRASLAAVRHDLGRHAEAAALQAKVVADRVRTLGPAHLATLQGRTSLGFMRLEAGDEDAADREFKAVLDEVGHSEHPDKEAVRHDARQGRALIGEHRRERDT
jgi:tetratricopeptide (TPR) repeat protein